MPHFEYEKSYAPRVVCGVDEAGRGPWAGPVMAAAVIFKPDTPDFPSTLNDSKQVKKADRETVYEWIMAHAIVGIGTASAEEIDHLNILHATYTAMQRAVASLSRTPDIALIDGNRKPPLPCESITVIKGDSISYSIAAASIIAKVTRDRFMQTLHETYPVYGFAQHVGYGTKLHQEALETHGPCPEHRKSFAPIRALLAQAA